MKFNIGDKVKVNCSILGKCEGTILGTVSGYYTVEVIQPMGLGINGTFTMSYFENEIEPINNTTYSEDIYLNFWEQEPKRVECYHDWKVYTGLERRFDYCTKCNITKNERRAYE